MRISAWHVVSAGLLLTADIAGAHHSRSVYDLETEIAVTGTVVRYEWQNPHVYIYVEARDSEGGQALWEIEASPPALMRRRGWSRNTLAEGDVVSIRANPAKAQNRAMALGVALETPGGEVLDMLESASFADAGSSPGATAGSVAGTWLTILNPVARPFIFGPTTWPLTPEGELAIQEFEEEMNPGRDCIAYTAPFSMVFPDAKQILVDDDTVSIRSEFEGIERIVHMGQASGAAVPISRQGHSVGRWDGDALVVETGRFAGHRMGNAFMLPSGPQKRLLERFELAPDGTALTYSFELTDPDYLTAAVTGEVRFVYRPDLELPPIECDIENARRYLVQ